MPSRTSSQGNEYTTSETNYIVSRNKNEAKWISNNSKKTFLMKNCGMQFRGGIHQNSLKTCIPGIFSHI